MNEQFLTADEMEILCVKCADKMRSANISKVKLAIVASIINRQKKSANNVSHLKGINTNKKKQLMQELFIGNNKETVRNPFSGESVELEPEAVALYDYIKGCELSRNGRGMEIGMDIFMQNWPDAYMKLLD